MSILRTLNDWLEDNKNLILYIALLLSILKGCNFTYTNNSNYSISTPSQEDIVTDTSSDNIIHYGCNVPKIDNYDIPKMPIISTGTSKEVEDSLVRLIDYIVLLRGDISDLNNKIIDNNKYIKEKCQK